MSRQFVVRSVLVPAMLLCASAAFADAPPRDASFVRLPLTFEKNTGRYGKHVEFLARAGGATVFITKTETVMVLRGKASGEGRGARSERDLTSGGPSCPSRPSADHVLRMKLVSANGNAVATGMQKQPGIVNYFVGNDPSKWRTCVPTYAKAKLAGVYPGVDIVYYGTGPRATSQEPRAGVGRSLSALGSQLPALEYDLIIKPGADPKRIRLAFEGADRIRVADGDLILSTPAGDVRMKRPYAYQMIGRKRVQVACDYRIGGAPRQDTRHPIGGGDTAPTVGFRLARYDASRPLVVDPMVMLYSTFLGGFEHEWGYRIAADASGCVVVAGVTASSNFPTTDGALDDYLHGDTALFVSKLNSEGRRVIYSTYVDSPHAEYLGGMALDASGAVYLTGETDSNAFPVTYDSFCWSWPGPGSTNGFVTKLGPSGAELVYSAFLGGGGDDRGAGIAVNASGEALVTGYTTSPDFPTSAGALDTTHNGGQDAFVTKVNAAGTDVVYSTYLGGSLDDAGEDIALGPAGKAHVVGRTRSSDFPTTAGAFDTTHNGGDDAFVARLNAAGSGLAYSTVLGGGDDDVAVGIAVSVTHEAYVTGHTGSSDFPTTAGAFDTTHNGGYGLNPHACFVTRLNSAGSALIYSTFLGGIAPDYGEDIAVDASDSAFIVGRTWSADFPTTPGRLDGYLDGLSDAFITKLDAAGSALVFSTYYGGSENDSAYGIALHSSGLICFTGGTYSMDFPRTYPSYQTVFQGTQDVWVAKLGEGPAATTLYTIDRTGTITENVILRQYDLKRTADNALLEDKRISFRIDGTEVGTAETNEGGDSTPNWAITDGLASRTISAVFAGTDQHTGSSDDAVLTARSWPTKMVVFDRTQRIAGRTELKCRLVRSDDAPLSGKPIAFSVAGTFVVTRNTDASGYARWPVYEVPDGDGAGARVINALWAGTGGYAPISGTATLTVLPALPYIWVLPKSGPQMATANLYAYFRRLPDYQQQVNKTVAFKIDGTVVGTAVTGPNGVARHPYQAVEPPGTHTIRCEFAGDVWVDAGYGEANLTIY